MEQYYELIPEQPASETIKSGEELEYPVSKVFLNRNLKKTKKVPIPQLRNRLPFTISTKHLRIRFASDLEDTIIRKRPKLSE